jgi:hypothetical protein
MRRPLLERVALCFFFATLGCASSSAPPPDTSKQAVTDATARIEGSWNLVTFQPAQPLEPMLQALLTAQLNHLVVTFHAGTLSVQGVGVDAQRAFTVTSAAADGFSATITDPTNVVYQVNGGFQGTEVGFTSLTDPWRGQGVLRRAQ